MKLLKKIEFILYSIAVVAIILRILKLPFAGIVLVVSLSSLAIIYWINAFGSFRSWKSSKAVSLLNFSSYFFSSFLIAGLLYLMMFWPGGGPIIFQSLKIYFFILLFTSVYSFFKYKENAFVLWKNVKYSFLKFSFLIMLGFLMWLLPDEVRIKMFASDPDKARAAIEYFKE